MWTSYSDSARMLMLIVLTLTILCGVCDSAVMLITAMELFSQTSGLEVTTVLRNLQNELHNLARSRVRLVRFRS